MCTWLHFRYHGAQYLLACYVGQPVAAANKVAYDGQTPEFVFQERQQLPDVVTPLTQAVRGPSGALKAEGVLGTSRGARTAVALRRRGARAV